MAHTIDKFAPYLGPATWGDVWDLTFYRAQNGRLVWYPKTRPKSPASPAQAYHRDRMRLAAKSWNALDPAGRAAWRELARRARIRIGPCALYYAAFTQLRPRWLETIERQTGISVPRPPTVPLHTYAQ